MKSVGILGGGAAGFFAAVQLAELAKGSVKITILEKGNEPLAKVKISGGGRCNVTHHLFDPELLSQKYPRGSKELRAAFARFQPKDTIEWFAKRGVRLKTEKDGRMFPETDSSSTIINCFMKEIEHYNISLKLNSPIQSVFVQKDEQEKRFRLTGPEGGELFFDFLLVATGSNRKVWGWMEALGHSIESPVPSLFTLNVPNSRMSSLPGTSVPNAEIKIHPKGKPQNGPLLITHWGFSGPAVLRLSAWEARTLAECEYRTKIRINWTGNYNGEEYISYLQSLRKEFPSRYISSTPTEGFSARLWETFLKNCEISPEKRWSEISNKELNQLREEVTNGIFDIDGKAVFKEEFVTCGGIRRKEVDFRTMESRILPRLFFAGEVLDIDGITGGFNFQNAWTTGAIAAEAIASMIE